jgi:hypothetical protein
VNRRHGVLGLAVGCICAAAAWCQSTDWNALWRELASADRAARDAAIARASNNLIPKIAAQGPGPFEADVAAIIEGLGRGGLVRQAASGLLSQLVGLRHDGSQTLRMAVPVWLSQFDDPDSYIRGNAVAAISGLRPQIPREALGPLLRAARGEDLLSAEPAMYGVARFADSSTEAVKALTVLLSREQPSSTRFAAVGAVRSRRITHPAIVAKVGECLEADDRQLVRLAISALATINALTEAGPRAVAPFEPALRKIAARGGDKELSDAASSLVKEIQKHR